MLQLAGQYNKMARHYMSKNNAGTNQVPARVIIPDGIIVHPGVPVLAQHPRSETERGRRVAHFGGLRAGRVGGQAGRAEMVVDWQSRIETRPISRRLENVTGLPGIRLVSLQATGQEHTL